MPSGQSIRIHLDDKELSSPITVSTLSDDQYVKPVKQLHALHGHEDSMFSDDTSSELASPSYNQEQPGSDELQRAIQVILANANRLGMEQHHRARSHSRGRSRGESYDQYGDAQSAEVSHNDSYVDGRDRNDSLDSVNDHTVQSAYNKNYHTNQTPGRTPYRSRQSSINDRSAISSMRTIELSSLAGVGSILDVSKLKEAQSKYVDDVEAEQQRKTELNLTDEEIAAQEKERAEAAKRIRTPLRWNNRVTGVINVFILLAVCAESIRGYLSAAMNDRNWAALALLIMLLICSTCYHHTF